MYILGHHIDRHNQGMFREGKTLLWRSPVRSMFCPRYLCSHLSRFDTRFIAMDTFGTQSSDSSQSHVISSFSCIDGSRSLYSPFSTFLQRGAHDRVSKSWYGVYWIFANAYNESAMQFMPTVPYFKISGYDAQQSIRQSYNIWRLTHNYGLCTTYSFLLAWRSIIVDSSAERANADIRIG